MTPKNFYDTLTSKLQEQLGPEWTTELCTDILANNGKKKIVIAIGRRGTTIYPSLSIEAYFEQYMHGKEMEQIIEEILATLQKSHYRYSERCPLLGGGLGNGKKFYLFPSGIEKEE